MLVGFLTAVHFQQGPKQGQGSEAVPEGQLGEVW